LSARLFVALLLAVPLVAHAAGLGKLSVLSALGRPLNAEIEVLSIPRGDVESLTARLASNEAFRQAGIEFNPALLSIRMAVERRGAGAVVKLTSTQPLNEPFLDVLIELQWASGRLVREYTFLLDPPGYGGPQVIAASPAPAAPKPAVAAAPAPESAVAAPAAQAPTVPPVAAPALVPAPGAAATAPEAGTAAAPIAVAPAAAESKPAAAELPPTGEVAPATASAAEQPSEPAATPVTPETRLEERPLAQEAAPPEAETTAAAPAAQEEEELKYEVKKGDTLSEIAQRHFVPGVTLNQMLIALYRENEDAFIRGNVNLVREGRILTIPRREVVGAVDPDEARQLVLTHMADFGRYRSRLAAAAAQRAGEVAAVEQRSGGQIETRPEQSTPAGPKDQVKLSKADPSKPSAAASKAAREDDIAARERALQEAQSRVADLEKNVLDLRKLLELKNQQLAELEKRAAGKVPEAPRTGTAVAAASVQPEQTPKSAPAKAPATQAVPPAQKAPETPKPAAAVVPPPTPLSKAPAAPSPSGAVEKAPEPAKPAKAPEPVKPAPEAAKAPEPPKPAAAPKPKPKPAPPPAPAPSFFEEFIENPVALGGLGAVFVILLGYGAWAWRRKKAKQTTFQDSVLGPASAAGASSVFGPAQKAAAGPSSVVLPSVSQASVGGMETDEVDPIAEADVYMAYGRDAQAEEILREALEKDASRTAIHEKLLEIYANRRDPKAFEQVALKLKEITGGAGQEWDKAVALGRSIDAQNTLYGGTGRSAMAAPAAPAESSALDFDLDATSSAAGAPDLLLGAGVEEQGAAAGSVDIDLGAAGPATEASGFTTEGTLIVEPSESRAATGGLDLDLGGPEEPKLTSEGIDFELPGTQPAPEPAPTTTTADAGSGVDFDLQLDLGETKAESPPDLAAAAAPLDLSSISLDLGAGPEGAGALGSTDPKWQEVATKLDLAKAYEEMGDKSGASELLNEVLREGDGTQRSQAQELLAKLT
jgi:pilus assembly protein FimV